MSGAKSLNMFSFHTRDRSRPRPRPCHIEVPILLQEGKNAKKIEMKIIKIINNDFFKLSRASGAIKIEILVKKYVFLQDMSSRRPLTDQNKPFFIFFRIFDQNFVKVVLKIDFSKKKLTWQCQGGAKNCFFKEIIDVAMSRWS